MEKRGTAVVLYMTGTGNTARAAGVIGEELVEAGWTVTARELRRDAAILLTAVTPQGHFSGDLLVLCFPTLGFGMPALVKNMLRGLRGKDTPAAVFATWGGEGKAALWQARGFLARRGFNIVAAGGASYPFQWTQVMAPTGEDEARHLVDQGDSDVRRFAGALAYNLAKTLAKDLVEVPAWSRPARPKVNPRNFIPVLLGLLVAYLYTWIGRSGLAALYAADSRCNACGKCANDCPAGAITLSGTGRSRRPRWNGRCQGCNRCINLCARGAIQSSLLRTAVHLPLNVAVVWAIVAGLNVAAAALPAPAFLSVPAYTAALIALVVIGSRLQFRIMEPVLFALESTPVLRGLIGRSWTARFPRYRCKGFTPSRPRG
jgi:ferredoxin